MKNTPFIAALLFLALALAAPGCGMFGEKNVRDSTSFDTPAQVLATEAEALYRDGEYSDAAELYQQIKDRYPYSRYALLADLRVADAYRKADRAEEAILAYDDFIRLHPKNEAVPYAIYQMGMVNFDAMLTVDRDPTFARKASEAFQRLMREYPKSEYAARAQPRLKEALERQAGHDFFVGKFYYRIKRYQAAIGRFKRVLTQYPDVGLYTQALGYIEKSQKRLATLSPEERQRVTEERRDLLSPPTDYDRPPVDTDDTNSGLPGIGGLPRPN